MSRPIDRIAPDDFVETIDEQAGVDIATLAEALNYASHSLPSTTDPETHPRCPGTRESGAPCLSIRLHYRAERAGEKLCATCENFTANPVAPLAAFGADEPRCPSCGEPRIVDATGVANAWECLDCGETFDTAADATDSPLMEKRIKTAREAYRTTGDEITPDMTRYAALVAYCRVAAAAGRAEQLAAALEVPTDDTDNSDIMNDTHAFEWIDTDELKRPAERVRAQPPQSDDDLAAFVLRLYRPWDRHDGDPSYRDIAAAIPYSNKWVGDRVREWRERREQVGAWPTVDADASSTRAAATDGGEC